MSIYRIIATSCAILIISGNPLMAQSPAFSNKIGQKIKAHFQNEQNTLLNMLKADRAGDLACEKFTGQADTAGTTVFVNDGFDITTVGRATTSGNRDPVYQKLHLQLDFLKVKACPDGFTSESYSNGICSNTDLKTGLHHRKVSGRVTCRICDADCQSRRREWNEKHKNDLERRKIVIKDNDRITAIYMTEASPLHSDITYLYTLPVTQSPKAGYMILSATDWQNFRSRSGNRIQERPFDPAILEDE